MLKRSLLALALGTATLTAMSAHAVSVNNGDKLNITTPTLDGNGFVQPATGSWFGMDANGNGVINAGERIPLSQGTTGLVIGVTTLPGASHIGAPTAGDTNAIDAAWSFFGNTGSDFLSVAVTGSTTAGLDMTGWRVTWSGIPSINMGGGAWDAGFSDGIGNFVWDGVYGDPYTVDYHATVPIGDPSNFGGVKYALHLQGTVTAVPEASTYGMMLAGLSLVGLRLRRRAKGERSIHA
jgi:hypothetical protein